MCIAKTLVEDKTRKLKEFYQYSNYNCCIGKYDSCEIAKMELNIVLFILHDGTTYDNHGSMFAAKRVHQVLRNLKKYLRLLYSLLVFSSVLNLIIFKDKVKNCWWKILAPVRWEHSLNKNTGEHDMSIPSTVLQVGRRAKLYLCLCAVV